MQNSPPSWQSLLKKFVADLVERQRIADESGLNPATLMRWANHQSIPRTDNLIQLLKALSPEQRERFLALLPKEFQEVFAVSVEEQVQAGSETKDIPSTFYASLLTTYVRVPQVLRFRSFCDAIFQEILKQLDINRLGMEVTVAVCMTPRRQKIYSLHEIMGRGTPPWEPLLKKRRLFLAEESLAGYATKKAQERAIQSRDEGYNLFPAHWMPNEQSAAAFPLLFERYVAGALIVSSAQPNYFTPVRMELLKNYANLMVLAFDPKEFYPLDWLQLFPMPPHDIQEQHLTQFRERANRTMMESRETDHPLTILQAEDLVWQQMEMELLQIQAKRISEGH